MEDKNKQQHQQPGQPGHENPPAGSRENHSETVERE